jgi:hypothetical protein
MRDVIRGRIGFGSWGRHVAQWNPQRRPNTLVLRFEELTADPIAQVERLGSFLGVSPVGRRVPTFEDLHKTAPNFFRSGRADSWKSLFSDEDHLFFWDLHGASMHMCGYEKTREEKGAPLHNLLRQHRRIAYRWSEATRQLTDAGRITARRLLAGLSPAGRRAA